MINRIISIFLLTLGLGFFAFLTFLFYDTQKINLNDYKKYENTITKKGINLNKHNQKIFYLKLSGINEKIEVYRMFKNYEDLMTELKIGDKIKIYYKPSLSKNENLNIVQIEKKEKIVLNKNEQQTKYRIMIVVSIFAFLYMIYCILCVIKYGKVENIIPPIF